MSRPSIDTDPGRHLLETGDHPQQRRLAAAGRPDKHEELAIGDLEIHIADRDDTIRDRPSRGRGH